MKKKKFILSTLITSLFLLNGCGSDSDTTVNLANSFEINATGLYPEGITYSHQEKLFYLSSYHQGKIMTLDKNGKLSLFTNDKDLVTVVGMKIDAQNNRLIACNTDLGFSVKSSDDTIGRLAKIEMYDLNTKKKIKTYNLANLYQGGHFVNDLTLDKEGNIYVTDSFSPVIYKISTKGETSIFAQDDRFVVEQGQFGLNGIVANDDYLIVAKSQGAKLFKIALNNGEDIKKISINKNLNSIDGLLFNDKNELLVVSNNFVGEGFDEAVYKLTSSDNWSSATVLDSLKIEGNVYPTTLTNVQSSVYVNYSYLPKLITQQPNVKVFRVEKVVF